LRSRGRRERIDKMNRSGNDFYRLKNNCVIEADQGIIGLSSEIDDAKIYQGCNGYILEASKGHIQHELTEDEKIEIADYMIERWITFRNSIIKEKKP
jgi:hypothetical protein